jgi:UDP-N-acetyl-D-galactosamine dehydrogenase
VKGASVGLLGLTFKENVADLRNSRVPDIIDTLGQFGIEPMVHDPHAFAEEAAAEYGIELQPLERLQDLDALVLAVPHRAYLGDGPGWLFERIGDGGVLIDVKSAVAPDTVPGNIRHWSL